MEHKELIQELAGRLNWTPEKISETLEASVEIITDSLINNTIVSIQDFGVLKAEMKLEHIYVDSDTLERFLVPPKIEIGFEPSIQLKEKFENIKNS